VPPRVEEEPTQTSRALPLLAQERQRGAVHALGAEDVNVILLDILVGRERLGGAEHHVPGIVDDHVEPARIGEDMGDRCFRRCVGLDVELDGAEVRLLLGGPLRDLGDLGRIATLGLAHRSIDNVAGLGERAGGHKAEARGRAGDEDDMLGHVEVLSI
jgi:hypothetical protein